MQLERHNVEEKVTEQVAIGRAAFLSTGAAAVAAAVMAGTGAMVAAPRIAAADIGGKYFVQMSESGVYGSTTIVRK